VGTRTLRSERTHDGVNVEVAAGTPPIRAAAGLPWRFDASLGARKTDE
jgi:hypothetical protein